MEETPPPEDYEYHTIFLIVIKNSIENLDRTASWTCDLEMLLYLLITLYPGKLWALHDATALVHVRNALHHTERERTG